VRAFKASVGTLVRAADVPVLPIYVEGSDRVLPKGKAIPRGREVAVHVGPPISAEFLAAATRGRARGSSRIARSRRFCSVPSPRWRTATSGGCAGSFRRDPLLLPAAADEVEEEISG
jgi:hypothetical protein